MERDTQRLLHTFAALADLGQEIADTGDFEEMLRASFHLLLGSLAIRRGGVAEYDREGSTLRLISARGMGEAQDLVSSAKNPPGGFGCVEKGFAHAHVLGALPRENEGDRPEAVGGAHLGFRIRRPTPSP